MQTRSTQHSIIIFFVLSASLLWKESSGIIYKRTHYYVNRFCKLHLQSFVPTLWNEKNLFALEWFNGFALDLKSHQQMMALKFHSKAFQWSKYLIGFFNTKTSRNHPWFWFVEKQRWRKINRVKLISWIVNRVLISILNISWFFYKFSWKGDRYWLWNYSIERGCLFFNKSNEADIRRV